MNYVLIKHVFVHKFIYHLIKLLNEVLMETNRLKYTYEIKFLLKSTLFYGYQTFLLQFQFTNHKIL